MCLRYSRASAPMPPRTLYWLALRSQGYHQLRAPSRASRYDLSLARCLYGSMLAPFFPYEITTTRGRDCSSTSLSRSLSHWTPAEFWLWLLWKPPLKSKSRSVAPKSHKTKLQALFSMPNVYWWCSLVIVFGWSDVVATTDNRFECLCM